MRPLGFGEIEELALSDSVGARWQMPAPSPNSLGPESELSVHRTILSILSFPVSHYLRPVVLLRRAQLDPFFSLVGATPCGRHIVIQRAFYH